MENLQDLDVSCADNLTCETLTIHPLKSITCADSEVNAPTQKQYRCAPGIIRLDSRTSVHGLGHKGFTKYWGLSEEDLLEKTKELLNDHN
jgi:hypothetical protein